MATYNDMLKANNPTLQVYEDAVQQPSASASAIRKAQREQQGRTARMASGSGARLATAAQFNPTATQKGKNIQTLSAADEAGRLSFYDFANTTIGRLDKKTRSYASYLRNVSRDDTVESYAKKQSEMKTSSRTKKRRKDRAGKILNMYKDYLKRRSSSLQGAISGLQQGEGGIQSFVDTASARAGTRYA
jgi:hypothetical protein